jgi:Secretion system C-terminal sorting domain
MPNDIKMRYILFICLSCFSYLVCAQKTIYVSTQASGGNTGVNWQDAYSDLHSALNASVSGDSIFVKSGIYQPSANDRGSYFEMKSGVHLYGGFAGTESYLFERKGGETILSGNIGNSSDSTDNSYTILAMIHPDSTTLIDGCTFEGGYAYPDTIAPSTSHLMSGGAVYIMAAFGKAKPTFRHCVFRNNYARSNGGAIYVYDEGVVECVPSFIDCLFLNNYAHMSGGALFLSARSSSQKPLSFYDCDFIRNTGRQHAGGIYINLIGSNQILLTRDTFIDNTAILAHAGMLYLNTAKTTGFDLSIDSLLSDGNAGGITAGITILSLISEQYPASLSIKNSKITRSRRSQFNTGNALQFFWLVHSDVATFFHISNSVSELDTVAFQDYGFFLNFDTIQNVNNRFLNQRHTFYGNGRIYTLVLNNVFRSPTSLGFPLKGIVSNNIFGSTLQTILESNPTFGSHKSLVTNNLFLNLKLNRKQQLSTNSATIAFYNNIFSGCRDSLNKLFIPISLPFNPTFDFNAFDVPCNQLPVNVSCTGGNIYMPDVKDQWVNAAQGDYRLKTCSKLIHKGFNAAQLPSYDFARNDRIIDRRVDIGPFEALTFLRDTQLSVTPTCTNTGSFNLEIPFACSPVITTWLLNDTLSGSGTQNLSSGSYVFNVTDQLGRNIQLPITIPSTSQLSSLAIVDSVQCGSIIGGTAILAANGGSPPYSLVWSDGLMSQNLTRQGLAVGNYQITLTDQMGCSTIQNVNIPASGALTVLLDAEEIKCHGDSSGAVSVNPLNGLPPFKWLWSAGDTTAQLQNIPSGNYTVTVTDQLGCSRSTTFQLNQPSSLSLMSQVTDLTNWLLPNGAIQVSGLTGGAAPYRFMWNTGDTTSFLQNLDTGIYILEIRDFNECVLLDTFYINGIVDTKYLLEAEFVKINPNPVINLVNINYQLPAQVNFSVFQMFNSIGVEVLNKQIQGNIGTLNLEVQSFPDGFYFWKFSTENHTIVSGRLVKGG